MLPHTKSAVSAFPEDDVGRPTQFASKTGVGTTGLFLCYNGPVLLTAPEWMKLFLCRLAFTRCCLISRRMCTSQYYSLQTPPVFGRPSSPLHSTHFYAICCFPSTRLYCNIYHTLLLMTISCGGQCVACHHRPGCLAAPPVVFIFYMPQHTS